MWRECLCSCCVMAHWVFPVRATVGDSAAVGGCHMWIHVKLSQECAVARGRSSALFSAVQSTPDCETVWVSSLRTPPTHTLSHVHCFSVFFFHCRWQNTDIKKHHLVLISYFSLLIISCHDLFSKIASLFNTLQELCWKCLWCKIIQHKDMILLFLVHFQLNVTLAPPAGEKDEQLILLWSFNKFWLVS